MENNSNIPKNNPFRVPDDYFENFNDKIIQLTAGKREISSFRNKRYTFFLSAAASLAVLVIAAYFATRIFPPKDPAEKFASQAIPVNEFILDELDILTIEESTSVSGIMDELPDIESSEIIDYLIREDVDIALIYEQL
ncbi:MAG TPA: hypothetical protein VK213_10215 [Bacteroidales bacterium]|nr:hypothetical protein [Bacteroidales bacterium]